MDRNELLLAGALAAALLATAAALPLVVDARPAYEIPVHGAADGEGLANATGGGWSEAPAASVPMSSAGAAVPNADEVTVEAVEVQAAQTDDRLYLRVSWADATRDTSTGEVRAFADAVAVQFPADGDARPPIAMGSRDNQVNVWFWNGQGRTEELLAGGPGSTTSFPETRVATDAAYDDGRWHVVFSRPLEAGGVNRTTIPADRDLDVAMAVWNGSNDERSGQKSTSEWYYLAMGPGPEGPPYEAILWVVAGIAIVATTLVTIEGVRRTRGE